MTRLAAVRAEGVLQVGAGQIADVDVAQARLAAQLVGAAQRGRRRRVRGRASCSRGGSG